MVEENKPISRNGFVPGPHVLKATGCAGGGPVSPTLCFFGRVKELLPGHINSFPHHPNPPPPPPSPSTGFHQPHQARRVNVFVQREWVWGVGELESSIMLLSSAGRLLIYCIYRKILLSVYLSSLQLNITVQWTLTKACWFILQMIWNMSEGLLYVGVPVCYSIF